MSSTPPPPPSIDVSKLPVGELGWERFVLWVASKGETVESDWIEVKSDVDPTSRVGAAKVARFILAAANRDPEKSAAHLDGHSVLLLGVAGEVAEGLSPVENLNITRLVNPFLGSDGPSWDLVRVPGTSGDVLVFVVPPPRVGDQIFIARKNGDGIRDGQIYVRVDGASEPNTSDQFDQLVARMSVRKPSTQLEISILGPIGSYFWDSESVIAVLEQCRSSYFAPLPVDETSSYLPASVQRASRHAARISALGNLGALQQPENRSQGEFVDEINRYVDECRDAIQHIADDVIARTVPPVIIRVENMNEQFLRSVEVVLHLSGDVEALPDQASDAPYRRGGLPNAPRAWGPRMVDLGFSSGIHGILPRYHPGAISSPNPVSWSNFENGGSIDGKVGFKVVRPRAIAEEETETVFVVRDSAMGTVSVDWSATVADVHDVFAGTFEVPVAPPKDITGKLIEAVRELLPNLDK